MTHYVYAGAAPWSGASPTDQPGGLFRQAIGSHEWQLLSNGLPPKAEIRAIAIHPQNSQIIYIGTQDGPYRSSDGGGHWERLNLPDSGRVIWSILLALSPSARLTASFSFSLVSVSFRDTSSVFCGVRGGNAATVCWRSA